MNDFESMKNWGNGGGISPARRRAKQEMAALETASMGGGNIRRTPYERAEDGSQERMENLQRLGKKHQERMEDWDNSRAGEAGYEKDTIAGDVANTAHAFMAAGNREIAQGVGAITDSFALAKHNTVSQEESETYYEAKPYLEMYDEIQRLEEFGTRSKAEQSRLDELTSRFDRAMDGNPENPDEEQGFGRERFMSLMEDRTQEEEFTPLGAGEIGVGGAIPEGMEEGGSVTRDVEVESVRDAMEGAKTIEGITKAVRSFIQGGETYEEAVYMGDQDDFTDQFLEEGKGSREALSEIWSNTDAELQDKVLDSASGLVGFLEAGLSSAGDNPLGAIQAIGSEVAAPVAARAVMGPAGIPAAAAGYSIDAYKEGLQSHVKENGSLPDEETRNSMAISATLMGVLNAGGDMAGVNALKKLTMPATRRLTGAAGEAVGKGGRLAGRTAAGAASGANQVAYQGAQEVAATYFEGEARLRPATAEEYQTAFTLGAGMGAASGTPQAVRDTGIAAAQYMGERKQDQQKRILEAYEKQQQQEREAAQSQAEAEGRPAPEPTVDAEPEQFSGNRETFADIDPIADNNTDTYNPEQAINSLSEILNNEETTQEDRVGAQERIESIVQREEQGLETLEQRNRAVSAETEVVNQERLKNLRNKRQAAKRNPEEAAKLDAKITAVQGQLDIARSLKQNDRKQMAEMEKAQRTRVKALREQQSETANKESKTSPDEINSLMDEVSQPKTETQDPGRAIKSADRLTRLAMANPDSVEPERLRQLAEDRNNNLTDEQRNLMTRFSDSEIKKNSAAGADGVNQAILFGDSKSGDMGVVDHQRSVASAVQSGKQDYVKKTASRFKNFVDGQTKKHTAMKEALKKAETEERPVNIVRDAADNWVETDLKGDQLKKAGGYTIADKAGSRNLIDNIGREADVMNSAYEASMAGAEYALPANGTVTDPVKTDQASQTSTTPTETSETEVTKPEETGTDTPTSTESTAPTEVNGTGVKPTETPTPTTGQDADVTPSSTETPTTSATDQAQSRQVDTSTSSSVDVNTDSNLSGRTPETQESQESTSSTPDTPKTASVPTQITNDMRTRLSDLGYSNDAVRQMTPQDAWNALDNKAAPKTDQQIKPTDTETLAQPDTAAEAPNGPAARAQENAQDAESLQSAVQRINEQTAEDTDGQLEPVVRKLAKHPDSNVSTQAAAAMYRYMTDGDFGDAKAVSDSLVLALNDTEDGIAVLQDSNNGRTQETTNQGMTEDQSLDEQAEIEAGRNTDSDVESTGAQSRAEPSQNGTQEAQATTGTQTPDVVQNTPEQTTEPTTSTDSDGNVVDAETGELIESGETSKPKDGRLEKTARPAKGETAKTNFRQPMGKDKKSQPYLVAKPDVLSNRSADWMENADVDHKITPVMQSLMDDMWALAERLNGTVAGLMPKADRSNADYDYRDPMRQLQNEDGTWAENMLTGISVSALNWIKENGRNSLFNSERDVKQMFGWDAELDLPQGTLEMFAKAGINRDVLIRDLGAQVVRNLGIKPDKKTATMDELTRLETSVGQRVYSTMVKEGLVHESRFTKEEVDKLSPELMTEPEMTMARLSFDYDAEAMADPDFDHWLKNSSKLGDVINRVLTAEDNMNFPSFEPRKFTQKTLKNMMTGIPSNIAKALAEHFKKPYMFREDGMGRLLDDVLGEEQLREIADYKDSNQWVHPNNVDSQASKNEGIDRDFRNMWEFRALMRDAFDGNVNVPFYLGHDVWSNQRVGMAGHVNMQASKISRWFLRMEGWESDVDITNESSEQFQQFQLAVADAFGIKTDKMSNEAAIEALNKKLADPTIWAGVEAMQRVERGDDVSRELEVGRAIVEASKAGGEAFHTTAGLTAYAQYRNAKENGETGFKNHLVREIDGKTNGPMLTLWLMGGAGNLKELLQKAERGGFFTQASGYTNVSDWASVAGNNDLYQAMMQTIDEEIGLINAERIGKGWKPLNTQSITDVLGDLVADGVVQKAGRNLTKTPTTAINYGSGKQTAINGMADDFVDAFFAKIEKTQNDQKLTPQQKQKAVNDMLFSVNKLLWNKDDKDKNKITYQEAVRDGLPQAKINLLKDNFGRVMGNPIGNAIDREYGAFQSLRDTVTKAHELAFKLSEGVFQDYRAQAVANQEMNQAGTLKRDITLQEYEALRQRLKHTAPVMHSAMSLEAGEVNNGIHMSKAGRSVSDKSFYYVEGDHPAGFGNSAAKRYGTYAQERNLNAPGVAGTALGVQSTDSAINMKGYAQVPFAAHNQHDAILVLSDVTKEGARNLNKATLDTLMDYNIPMETLAMVERVVDGLLISTDPEKGGEAVGQALSDNYYEMKAGIATLMADSDTSAADYIAQTEEAGKTVLGEYAKSLAKKAVSSKILALTGLRELTSIDQYSMNDGQYELQADDYAKIDAKIEELQAFSNTLDSKIEQLSERVEAAEGVKKPQGLTSGLLGEGDSVVKTEYENALVSGANDVGNRARAMNYLRDLANSKDDTVEDYYKSGAKEVLTELKQSKMTVADALAKVEAEMEDDSGMMLASYLNEKFSQGTNQDAWGTVGKPTQASDGHWAAFFNKYGNVSGKQMTKAIKQKLKKDSTTNKTFAKSNAGQFASEVLLDALYKMMPDNIEVVYVTPGMNAQGMGDMSNVSGAKGWYERSGANANKVFIRSPDYVNSGLNDELMIHELTHAVLSAVIDNPQTKQQAEAVAGLERLRENFDKALNQEERESLAIREAASNVQEFVAYAMSNAEVQSKLKKIRSPEQADIEARADNKSMFKEFVEKAVSMIFRGSKGKTKDNQRASTMAHTFSYVSDLLQESAQEQEAINKSQDRLAMEAESDGLKKIFRMSVSELYDALGESEPLSGETDQRLRGLLDNLVESVHGPIGAGIKRIENAIGIKPEDLWQRAKTGGRTPFTSNTKAVGYGMTSQQEFMVEQIQAAMETAFKVHTPAYREAVKLYSEARKSLTPADFYEGDWSRATENEKALATERYKNVFSATGAGSRHLSQFIAMGLVHEGLSKKLSGLRRQSPTINRESIGGFVQSLFELGLDVIKNMILKTNNRMTGDERLEILAENIATVHVKRKQKEIQKKQNFADKAEDGVNRAVKTGGRGALKLVNATVLKERPDNTTWRTAVSGVLNTVSEGGITAQINAMKVATEANKAKRPGFLGQTIDEMLGTELTGKTGVQQMLAAAKNMESVRNQIAGDTRNNVWASFSNGGKDVTATQSKALTQVMVRNDLTALSDKYSMEELALMIEPGNSRIQAEAQVLEKRIGNNSRFQQDHIGQARALAYYMATGVARTSMLAQNAEQVAKLHGLEDNDSVSSTEVEALTPILDEYISLMALEYTDTSLRMAATDAIQNEVANNNGRGIEFTLGLLKSNKKESREKLFQNDTNKIRKGYSKEILNPYISTKVATEAEGRDLIAQGYESSQTPIWKDPHDPNRNVNHFMFVIEDGGLSRYSSAATSLTDKQAKGTGLEAQELLGPGGQLKYVTAKEQAQNMAGARAREAKQMFNQNKLFDPRKSNKRYRIPSFDNEGNVKDFSHVMDHNTRDSVLQRNNDLGSVLGGMEASVYDKSQSVVNNKEVVKGIKQVYDQEYRNYPRRFVEVGPQSDDPFLREVFSMMPSEMRKEIQQEWGRKGMKVRSDMVPMLFGNRRLSAADAFKKKESERHFVEQVMVTIAEKMYGKQAAKKVANAEDAWMTVVAMVKDNMIVKNLSTLLLNMKSNYSQLYMNGVGPVKAARYMWEGYVNGFQYRKDRHELFRLRQQMDAEFDADALPEVAERVAELEDAISRNPTTMLVEEGLMPNVVEDVDMVEDPFSYKKKFERKFEDKIEKIPEALRKTGKTLYMTQDTSAYKFMSQMTQMSDFTARYALYKHLREDVAPEDQMSHKQASLRALNEFIHYDLPTHPKLEWANNMGLLMYTRYYLRVQKMIGDAVQGNPGRALTTLALSKFLDEETILDSFGLGGFGLNMGAVEMLGAWDEPVLLNTAKGLLVE